MQKLAQVLELNKIFQGKEEDAEIGASYTQGERILAAASYIYFFAPAILLFLPTSPNFVKFHAKHALIFTLLSILLLLLPSWPKYVLFSLSLFVIFYSAFTAFLGKTYSIPWLTKFLQDFDI